MFAKHSKSTGAAVTLVVTALTLTSLAAPCLGKDGPRDPACDRFAIAAGSTATTSAGPAFTVSQDMITGNEIGMPRFDGRPAIIYLPLPPGLG